MTGDRGCGESDRRFLLVTAPVLRSHPTMPTAQRRLSALVQLVNNRLAGLNGQHASQANSLNLKPIAAAGTAGTAGTGPVLMLPSKLYSTSLSVCANHSSTSREGWRPHQPASTAARWSPG